MTFVWVQPKDRDELLARLADAVMLNVSERERENLCACALTEIRRLSQENAKALAAALSAPAGDATPPVCGGARIGWRTKEASCGTPLVYESTANGIEYWRCPACGNPHWWPLTGASATPASGQEK